ncbi:MAG: glycosyltransferase family 2 protein [Planctomycetota bacterium]|jgi:glycosyltransferase involved in cell wall biosynthesis
MQWSDVTVVMPARDEADCIGQLIAKVISQYPGIRILVVDDASKDDTPQVARRAGATVLRHSVNLGNGWSVRNGIAAADTEYIVLMDADGQHPPEAIAELVKHLGDYDLVVGCRSDQCDVSRFRTVGNRCFQGFARWICGGKVGDLTSGFRAFRRRDMMPFLPLFPRRYSYPTTSTLAYIRNGRAVRWVAMDNISRRQSGRSGIKPLRDSLRFMHIILRVTVTFGAARVFVPLGLSLLLLAMVAAILQLVFTGKIGSASVILVTTAMNAFCFGILADMISSVRTTAAVSEELYAEARERVLPPEGEDASIDADGGVDEG